MLRGYDMLLDVHALSRVIVTSKSSSTFTFQEIITILVYILFFHFITILNVTYYNVIDYMVEYLYNYYTFIVLLII